MDLVSTNSGQFGLPIVIALGSLWKQVASKNGIIKTGRRRCGVGCAAGGGRFRIQYGKKCHGKESSEGESHAGTLY